MSSPYSPEPPVAAPVTPGAAVTPAAPVTSGAPVGAGVVPPALPPGAAGFAPPNRLALWGMIVSISLYVVPLLINAPIGLVLSILGLRRARALDATKLVPTGRGMAIAGIIIGAFGTASAIILLLIWFLLVPVLFDNLRETGFFNG